MKQQMIEVGSRVRAKGALQGLEGLIVRVREGTSRENHGTIEVKVTNISVPENYSWLKVGDLEHFVHFEWQDALELIPNKKEDFEPWDIRYACIEIDELQEKIQSLSKEIEHLTKEVEFWKKEAMNKKREIL